MVFDLREHCQTNKKIGTAGKDNAERNVKLEIGGYVSLAPPVTKYCNTMDCSKPFFAQYVYGFGRALQNVNHDWLMQLTEEVRFGLSAIPAAELGENGRHFFNTSFCDTAFAYACAQVMLPGKRCDPVHFDGGASALVGILTLYGDRSVHFEVDGAWLPSAVQQKPGSFYIGSLASVYHFVEHLKDHGPLYHEESDGQGARRGLVQTIFIKREELVEVRTSTSLYIPAHRCTHTRTHINTYIVHESLSTETCTHIHVIMYFQTH